MKKTIEYKTEVGWINKNQLLLSMNDQFFIMNFKHFDLIKVNNNIMYGRQQTNMEIFCSISKKRKSTRFLTYDQEPSSTVIDSKKEIRDLTK